MEIRPDEPDTMYCTRRALSRVLEIFVGAELSRVYLLKFVKRGDDLNGTQSLRFSAGNPNRASRGVRAARLCRNAREDTSTAGLQLLSRGCDHKEVKRTPIAYGA